MRPTYELSLVKALMRDGCWIITESAADTAIAMGFDEADVYDCIVNHLVDTHFYKTMSATKRSGLMQDVYRITYRECRIYLKLQVNVNAVVISFKEQE